MVVVMLRVGVCVFGTYSAFAPTDCKLVSQYMVLDHMMSHYKKLNNVKGKPPYLGIQLCIIYTIPSINHQSTHQLTAMT